MLSKRNVKGRAGAAPAPSPRPAVRCVLRFVAELLRESKGNPEENITEAEFLVNVLTEHGLVDVETLVAVRAQFQHLVRHAKYKPTEPRVLTAKVVFAELVERKQVLQTGAAKSSMRNGGCSIVDLTAVDGGFEEWRANYWLPQLDPDTYKEHKKVTLSGRALSDSAVKWD